MEDRRKEHICIYEGDIAVLKEWMKDTKYTFEKIQSVFIQNFIQLIVMVAILIVTAWKLFAK